MMFKRILWMTMLILMSHLLYAQTTTVPYMPNDDENIVNPDRGFYFPIYPPAEMGNFTPMTPTDLANKRQNLFDPLGGAEYQIRTGLFYRYYVLDRNADANAVADFAESSMQQDFDALRQAGGRLIVRFAYTIGKRPECPGVLPCSPYGDAPPATVTAHIRALEQVLKNNEDVIAAVQIGFIGVWGEQYYTDYFGDASKPPYMLSATNWTNRNQVVSELLDAVPTSRMVQIRYPQMKQKFFSGATAPVTQTAINQVAMTAAEAYTGTDKARLGLHNDCFLVDATDSGTYIDYGPNSIGGIAAANILKPYAMNEGKYTAVGGETCYPPNGELNFYNSCENAKKDMEELHFSYLNASYYNPINNQWKNTCMPEIKRKLGYRFVMQNGTYPNTASAGSTIPITLNVLNEGYAAPYNERELWLVFRGPSGTKKAKINGANVDTRHWYSGNVATVNANVTVPADLSNGNYELLLHILDPSSGGRIADRSEYSIQLANTGTWEATTGFNKLNHTITIGGTPPPSSGCITIDQSLSDWQTINTLSFNNGFTLKAADDNSALYISVTGNIGPYYQIFLDTDNNNSGSNEFSYFGTWSQTGFNAMIENGAFSSYTGTGSDWLWSAEIPLTHSRTAAGVELKVDKSLLNASSNIRIGFASLDNTWTGVGFAPAGNSAAAYTLTSSLNCNTCPDSDNDGVCDADDACPGIDDAIIGTPCSDNDVCTTGETYNNNCDCTGGTSQDADQDNVCAALDPDDNDPCVPNACNECIVIDQSLNDWSAIAPLSANGNFSLKAADDNNSLYISVTGTIGDFGNGYQIFIDTDNNNSGANEFAYFSAWSQTRFNAMIENGAFSSYTGTGSDWLWSTEIDILDSKTTAGVEFKIDKSLLNTNSSVIRIGFASLSNWSGVAFVPTESTAVAYTMSSALNCDGTCPDSDGDGVCDNEDACPGVDDAIIGTSCNDNDACTTGDTYNANCSCEGTFQDADNDGVCDANDVCPGMNDALIGTACDDGDDCTAGEIYNANCNCTGGTYICNNDCIIIDGDLSDWSAVAVLAANGLTLKAADDNMTFYLYIVGNIGPNYAIFLDTNNSSTGYSNTGWGQTAFNFMIENGTLYAYTGSGTDWNWSNPIAQLNVKRIASGVELEVDKSLLGSNISAANLGFVSMDVNWSEVATVPTANAAAHALSSSLNCGDDCPDADDDGICAGDDPNDNDPCTPNSCNTCNIFDRQNFDTNWGIWNDGGGDAYRYTGYANSGTRSIRLRDNSGRASSIYTNILDLSAVNSINVSFSYITNSMDNSNEDFFFELSTDGGSSYTIIEEWNLNDEFVNGTRYNETLTMTTYEENFTDNTVLRFRCDASGNGDQVYIDDIVIEACGGTISSAKEEVATSLSAKLYPNPARDILNIDFENAIDQEGTAHIFTTSGQLVNQQNIPSNIHNMTIPIDPLPAGIYIIRLQFDNGLYSTQRFVKLSN